MEIRELLRHLDLEYHGYCAKVRSDAERHGIEPDIMPLEEFFRRRGITMIPIGEGFTGIWPEFPIEAGEGESVRYPLAGTGIGEIARAKIDMIVGDVAYLDNGDWCYLRQVSADHEELP
jgi:hypothetical protein